MKNLFVFGLLVLVAAYCNAAPTKESCTTGQCDDDYTNNNNENEGIGDTTINSSPNSHPTNSGGSSDTKKPETGGTSGGGIINTGDIGKNVDVLGCTDVDLIGVAASALNQGGSGNMPGCK